MKRDLAELLSITPFVPFQVVLSSGDRYRIDDPDMVVLMGDSIMIARRKSERRDILRMNQLVAIEVVGSIE